MQTIKKNWQYLIIILSLLLLFVPFLNPPPGKMIFGEDIYEWEYFPKTYFAKSVREGSLPLWNPYMFSGMPFIPMETLYPGNILFVIFPFNDALSLFYFLHLLAGGIFMYKFCRKYTTKEAGLTAAIAFCLSPIFYIKIFAGFTAYVAALSYIPVI